jgi:hypothetical protein
MVVLLMQKGAQGKRLSSRRVLELLAQGGDATVKVVGHQTRHRAQVGLFVFVDAREKQ